MKSTIADIGENKRKLNIELLEDDFEKDLVAFVTEAAKTVELPGFRKGKVPPKHLRSKIGEEQLREDTLSRALPKYIQEAIEEEGLDAIAIIDVKILSQSPVTFEAEIEIRPEPELRGYESLKITVPPVLPTEEELKEIENNYLKSFGELSEVSRSAIKGDHLTIDLHSTFNGQEVEGMNVSDYVYELGGQSPIEEMEKELTGAKVGDILEFNASHPQEEGNMRVKVLVKKISENKLPELTDDLAKKISEFDTVDEMRQDLKVQVTASKRNSILQLTQERIVQELLKLISIPIPEAMMQNEVESIKSRLPEQQQNDPHIHEHATNTIKIDLAIRAVIRQENLELEEAELNEAVAQIEDQIRLITESNNQNNAKNKSQNSRQNHKQANKQTPTDLKPDISIISKNLLQQKAMEWLIEHAQITDENNIPVKAEDIKPPPKLEETEALEGAVEAKEATENSEAEEKIAPEEQSEKSQKPEVVESTEKI